MAESYISELGDSLSHGVSNTNGDRVKIIAPKLYNDGNGNHPNIATALSGKVDVNNVNLNSQTTTILAQVQSLASSQIHYKRFYTQSDGGSANISDKPTGTTNAGFMLEAYCNRYVSSSDWRYVVLCYVTTGRPKITWVTQSTTSISWQDLNTNTDTLVKATAKTDNVNYKVLATASASPTSGNATEAVYDTDISLNPSTNTITANVSGNAATSTKPLSTLLTSSDDLDNVKADSHGDVRTYHWNSGNVPSNSVNTTSTGMMQVFRTHSNQYCVQMAYICDLGLYKRVLVNGKWGAWSKILAQADVTDTYSSTGTAPVSGKAVASAISGKPDIYKWNAKTKGQTWSRIYYSQTPGSVIGSSGILWVGCARGNVVCNATFLVTTAHGGPNKSNIIELASCGYSSFRCRIVVERTYAAYYFEIYDTANSIASGTEQNWNCHYMPFQTATVTTYTAFTDGTTIPEKYGAYNDFIIGVGDESAAITKITRSGTTFTATRQNGSTFTFTQQDSDSNVTQTADDTSTGTGFELLFSATGDNTTRTETSRKSSKLTYQPSTGTLTATKFSGPLTGNVTGNCSGSSGSCTGNAATATTATNANITRTADTTNGDKLQIGTGTSVNVTNSAHAASADQANLLTKTLASSGTISATNIVNVTGSTDGFKMDYSATSSDAGKMTIYTTDDANAAISIGNTVSSSYKEAISIVNGSATVKGSLTGNVTGNCSGSSGSCTGNAATATKVSTTEDTANYLYILGVANNDSNFNVIKRDTNLIAYGGKLIFYENSKGNYLGVSGGQDASSAYSYLPPSGGTMISVNSDTEINMAITDNSNKVEFNMRKYAGVFAARGTPIDDYYFYRGLATTTNPSNNIESNIHAGKYTLSEKCTLQFNTTTNALDFVFA